MVGVRSGGSVSCGSERWNASRRDEVRFCGVLGVGLVLGLGLGFFGGSDRLVGLRDAACNVFGQRGSLGL